MEGYCGLNCALCEVYLATASDDATLRLQIASMWSRHEEHDFQPDQLYCTGCKSAEVQTAYCREHCRIRVCARQRGVASCRCCSDYPCALFAHGIKYLPYLQHTTPRASSTHA